MNRDALYEKLSHAVVVLDAGIAAAGLSEDQLKTLMHVALNLIEDAQSDVHAATGLCANGRA
jgi:hypothetical protein